MRVLIADGHVLFGEGLRSLLQAEQGFEIVGQARTTLETIEQTTALLPDVVLLSVNLADGNAFDALRAIAGRAPQCAAVVLTSSEADEELFEAFQAGAKGYVAKTTPVAHLAAALRALPAGQLVLSRHLANRLIQQFRLRSSLDARQPAALDQLTRREREVWQHVAGGATNQEIAAQLVISENTVKIHVRNILDKLSLKNRMEAASLARQVGYWTNVTTH